MMPSYERYWFHNELIKVKKEEEASRDRAEKAANKQPSGKTLTGGKGYKR